MPVAQIRCPDCGHEFRSLVMAGSRVPPVWVCSECGGRGAQPYATQQADPLSSGPREAPTCGCG